MDERKRISTIAYLRPSISEYGTTATDLVGFTRAQLSCETRVIEAQWKIRGTVYTKMTQRLNRAFIAR